MVEADEFYMKADLKGRPYNKDIMNSGTLKTWRTQTMEGQRYI